MLCPEQPALTMLLWPTSLRSATLSLGLRLEHQGQWGYGHTPQKFMENTCRYVHDSVGFVWKTTETPSFEAFQDTGFRREEVWALPADESHWGERRPASPSGYGSSYSHPA